MTTIERKKRLKSRIDISDEQTLDKIEKILEEEIFMLSEEQLTSVHEAKADYLKGNCTSDDDEQLEIEKWFLEQEK